MKFRSFPLLFILILAHVLPELAVSASRGKYAGEFMSIGVGGRALGMGGAFVALAGDVTAGYWNPAGLTGLSYPEIALMHDERFAGLVNYDYAAVALPMNSRSTLAFSVTRLGVDNILNTRNAGIDVNGNPLPPGELENFSHVDRSKITYFNSGDWALYLSYARKFSSRFSYGANVKFILRDAGEGSATGIGFDVAAQYRVGDRLAFGANFQDVTTTFVAWNTGTNELITPTLKLGSAYFIDAFDGRFAPALDVDIRFEGRKTAANAHLGPVSFDLHSGLEFDFRNLVAFRAGYSEVGSLNFGTGIRLPKFDIDYTYAKFNADDELGSTHRISLLFTLESERFLRSSK